MITSAATGKLAAANRRIKRKECDDSPLPRLAGDALAGAARPDGGDGRPDALPAGARRDDRCPGAQRAGVHRRERPLAAGAAVPEFDVIVVSDGSTDATVEVLRSAFDLEIFPRVYVPSIPTMPVRKVFRSRDRRAADGGREGQRRQGRRAQLRHQPGRPRADLRDRRRRDPRRRTPCCWPAGPFLEEPDEVVATGGIVRIANGCRIESRPRRAGGAAQVPAGGDPGGRVPARVPDRALGVEPRQRAADRQRRVRHLPPRRAARARRLPPRDGRRGRGAGRPHPPPLPRAGREVQGVLRARPGVLDRGAGDAPACCAASACAGPAGCSRS